MPFTRVSSCSPSVQSGGGCLRIAVFLIRQGSGTGHGAMVGDAALWRRNRRAPSLLIGHRLQQARIRHLTRIAGIDASTSSRFHSSRRADSSSTRLNSHNRYGPVRPARCSYRREACHQDHVMRRNLLAQCGGLIRRYRQWIKVVANRHNFSPDRSR